MIFWPAKASTEVEDFSFDFSTVLDEGETLATRAIAVDGVVKDSDTIVDGSAVQVWLSAGTPGSVAKATCTVTTNLARTYSEVAVLPIAGDVISLATAKAHQRIEGDEEDALLAGFLRAAVRAVETATGKRLRPTIERQVLSGFCGRGLRLFKGPVSEILSVEYDDADGVAQELASFRLVEGSRALLLPAFGEAFPLAAEGPGTVRVAYVAGYDPTELPDELVQAALLLFGHFNANREAVVIGSTAPAELPLGVQYLIDAYRSPGIA